MEEPRWDLLALAFLVEVSLMASAASLSCLPALCPLIATAAWDGARALCCCLGPALYSGSRLQLARSPLLPCAFQVLQCLDLTKCGDSILEIMSRYLQSKSRERRCLALRGLVVLSKDPLMVRRGQWLEMNLGKQLLRLAGFQELRQMLPALLPHIPEFFGTGLWHLGPVAGGWGCSARAVLGLQPFMASKHSLVFHTGQKNE